MKSDLFKRIKTCLLIAEILMIVSSCHKKHVFSADEEALFLHNAQTELTDVMVYDIFAPPNASRIYAYSSLAAYEAVRYEKSGYASITSKLKGFSTMPAPAPNKQIDFSLASLQAFCEVAKKLVFSSDRMEDYEQRIKEKYTKSGFPDSELSNSIEFGNQVAIAILKRAETDGYKETRGMPRFTVLNKDGFWQPTAPEYMDAVEPWFGKIHPFILDSSRQFKPSGPYPYSLNKKSPYYRDLMEVYQTGLHETPAQKEISGFWDCNPFIGHHTGHLMFATKKISPGGHWIGITGIACKGVHADLVRSAKTYAWVSVALFDGFISCWQEKYEENTVRPETVIQQKISFAWKPLLQCPPFPDYPSGHSVISAAASVVLGKMVGSHFSYTDSVEKIYGLKPRNFQSFTQAAHEAMISRLYGGIHERKACIDGFKEGTAIGELVLSRSKQ